MWVEGGDARLVTLYICVCVCVVYVCMRVSDLVSVCRVLAPVCVCGSGKECHAYFAASADSPTTNAPYQQQAEYALLLCSNEFYLVFRFNHMRVPRHNHVIQPDTHTCIHARTL